MLRNYFAPPLAVGESAPDFSLPDQDGHEVSLQSLRGRNVVLIFYPGDETPVCRRQLCDFRDNWAQAQSKNTLIFGVNPQDAESHARFRRNRHLPFPLLVDKGQKVARRYRADGWFIRRTVYLIGKTGVIQYAGRGRPPVHEVLAAAE